MGQVSKLMQASSITNEPTCVTALRQDCVGYSYALPISGSFQQVASLITLHANFHLHGNDLINMNSLAVIIYVLINGNG